MLNSRSTSGRGLWPVDVSVVVAIDYHRMTEARQPVVAVRSIAFISIVAAYVTLGLAGVSGYSGSASGYF